jgi:hypothetical protein
VRCRWSMRLPIAVDAILLLPGNSRLSNTLD